MALENYKNDIYAGVLGKIIGVYLGRPVEGWTFENIKNTFGKVSYYKNHKTGAPLIVPDDDISGTFAFFRALEDSGYKENISAEEIGDAWLNYIVENETILWWGGLCRSTEHTAYLRLKNGIKAPMSGSIALNGQSMAEQIGAEIFIDTWAMVNPGNPERACEMARKAASVSHDGVAVDAAVYLAAMEAMAFEEKDIDKLLDKGLAYIDNEEFKSLIDELREKCAKASDWYEVRQWIADEHGYDKYPGNCPMITNHLTLLMAFIMGGDDFQKACMIACSAGWDTDCNSGNVGCLNGIRLGLDGFTKGADLRRPVADRLYVVTSDGGSCISDAVIETRKILKAAAKLNGEEIKLPEERLAFEYPGSVQGIVPYDKDCEEQVLTKIENSYETTGEYGCRICYEGLASGLKAQFDGIPFYYAHMRGADIRVECLLNGVYDMAVVSRLAAESYLAQDRLRITLALGPHTYVGEHQLICRKGESATVKRVGLDNRSADQKIMTEACFGNRDVELIDMPYHESLQRIAKGDVDAVIWNVVAEAELAVLGLEATPLTNDPRFLQATEAVVLTRAEDYPMQQLLRAVVNKEALLAHQQRVANGEQEPSY